jgi:two-component system phosphate regulon response regulator PhoB
MMPSILVVEDEPAIQELLRVNLEDAGFAVRTVADAEAALVQIKRALPDLLLLDWMLPGQSGLALEPHACAHMIETVRGGGYRLAAPR